MSRVSIATCDNGALSQLTNNTSVEPTTLPSESTSSPVIEDIPGRLLTSKTPTEEVMIQRLRANEDTKRFTLRDVLGHRVSEILEDE